MSENMVEEVRKLIKTRKSINISRVPPQTMDLFLRIAQEEFCDDYGMTLRECVNALIELRKIKEGGIPMLYDIDKRLSALENKPKVESKVIRALDGRIINGGNK